MIERKFYFDLQLLELALNKVIDLCKMESQSIIKNLNINPEKLDALHAEKQDAMNFIEWHIPLIVRYIKMHKLDLDDGLDLYNLKIRAASIVEYINKNLDKKDVFITENHSIGNDKFSTLSIIKIQKIDEQQPVLDLIFVNDSDHMSQKISLLLKQMYKTLEVNFNKIVARKTINDRMLEFMRNIKSPTEQIYTKEKKQPLFSKNHYTVYNEDC